MYYCETVMAYIDHLAVEYTGGTVLNLKRIYLFLAC